MGRNTRRALQLHRCIYCSVIKSSRAFNREHVLHDAMGRFRNALVLTCVVCKECNDRFGKSIDLAFARDSPEAYLRYWHLGKSAQSFKHLGRRSTTRLETEDARVKHLIMHPVPLDDPYRFGFQPADQVVFAKGDRKISFLVSEIPNVDAMAEQGYTVDSDLQVGIMSQDPEPALAALRAADFPAFDAGEFLPMPARSVSGMLAFTVTHPQFRAVAKIALDYLAYVTSAGVALMPQFDRIRRYVCTDPVADSGLVQTLPPMGPFARPSRELQRVHWIAVERRGHAVIARLCFFSEISYEVLLSELPFHIGFNLNACHVYDLRSLDVLASAPPERWADLTKPFPR